MPGRKGHGTLPSGTSVRLPQVVRPLLFTLAGCFGSLLVAEYMKKHRSGDTFNYWKRLKGKKEPTTPLELWEALPEHQRTLSVLIGLNVLVFCGWRTVPHLIGPHFAHGIYFGKSYTLLTSMFSHHSAIHLLANMIALWSFGGILHQTLGRENFLAIYFVSGFASSYASHLLRHLKKDLSPSLGASGAIFGVVGGVGQFYPEATMLLFFVIPMKLLNGIMLVASADALGLLGFWRLFNFKVKLDHAAHLAGLACGFVMTTKTIVTPLIRKLEEFQKRVF